MEPGGALLRRPSARQGDDTEAAAPFRALLFALCLITVFVMLPLVILTDSNGWIARDAEDEREADQKSANAADENWVADSIFIFIYIGIRLCECVPRRIAFRREMARANEHTALINSTALTSVPPINGAARPVPQRVLDRVALERAAMTRATRPQPSSEPSARDLVDDLAVALARPAPVVHDGGDGGESACAAAATARDDDDDDDSDGPVRECCVCLERARDTVLSPCAHACVCAHCAERLMSEPRRRCPVCRASIERVIRVDGPSLV